jgi:hypothetical protein
MVALADVGAAAALVLQDPARHAYATYEVVSETTTFARIAAQLGAASGKHVECAPLARDTALAMLGARWESVGAQMRDGFEKMVDYYINRCVASRAGLGVPRVLTVRCAGRRAGRATRTSCAGCSAASRRRGRIVSRTSWRRAPPRQPELLCLQIRPEHIAM